MESTNLYFSLDHFLGSRSVCLIGHRLNEEAALTAEKAAWYDKKEVTFSDLLKAVRAVLWKDNLIFMKGFSDTSMKNLLQNDELKGLLVQILALAA